MPESFVIWNAVRVAVVIGTVLNLINHRDAIFSGSEWPRDHGIEFYDPLSRIAV